MDEFQISTYMAKTLVLLMHIDSHLPLPSILRTCSLTIISSGFSLRLFLCNYTMKLMCCLRSTNFLSTYLMSTTIISIDLMSIHLRHIETHLPPVSNPRNSHSPIFHPPNAHPQDVSIHIKTHLFCSFPCQRLKLEQSGGGEYMLQLMSQILD